LKGPFTAHPKICPTTGEMLAFGYAPLPPYLTYLRVAADGTLAQVEPITVTGPTMMHDFNITENYVIFMDLPAVFNLDLALEGKMPIEWSDSYPARLGVMPRNGVIQRCAVTAPSVMTKSSPRCSASGMPTCRSTVQTRSGNSSTERVLALPVARSSV